MRGDFLPSSHDEAPYQVAVEHGGYVWWVIRNARAGYLVPHYHLSLDRRRGGRWAWHSARYIQGRASAMVGRFGEAHLVHRYSQGPIPV